MLKHFAFQILRLPGINNLVRVVGKLLSPVVPMRQLSRLPVSGQISVDLPNAKPLILISDGQDSIANEIYWKGLFGFEPETLQLLFKLLPQVQVVFDVGAHTGLFALIAAIDDPNRQAHAFEPVPRIYDYLRRNVEANHLRNVHCVASAVGKEDGEMPLYIPAANTLPLSSSLLQGHRDAVETLIVPTMKLDTYAQKNNLARIDLIKIDTEFTETAILEGAQDILVRDEPMIISEVLGKKAMAALQQFFEGRPYRPFHITEAGLVAKAQIVADFTNQYRNYLFITPKRLATLSKDIKILEDNG